MVESVTAGKSLFILLLIEGKLILYYLKDRVCVCWTTCPYRQKPYGCLRHLSIWRCPEGCPPAVHQLNPQPQTLWRNSTGDGTSSSHQSICPVFVSGVCVLVSRFICQRNEVLFLSPVTTCRDRWEAARMLLDLPSTRWGRPPAAGSVPVFWTLQPHW